MSRKSFGFTAGRDVAVFIGVVFSFSVSRLPGCTVQGGAALLMMRSTCTETISQPLEEPVEAGNTMCGWRLRVSLYLEIRELT